MNIQTRTATSLTDGYRLINEMVMREYTRMLHAYCHPQLEWPRVTDLELYISPDRPDAHRYTSTVSVGDTVTHLYVNVAPIPAQAAA